MPVSYKGAIFDLDGVITQTAKTHYFAWKYTFESFLACEGHKNSTFDYDNDYVPFVDGKPRYEGVDSFLRSRGIELAYGNKDDAAGTKTVCGVGNQKNNEYRKIIQKEGAKIYDSTLSLIKKFEALRIPLGVASSSKNCTFILNETGLMDHFETVVDGNTSVELGLKGKPEPDIFLRAAEDIGRLPQDCIMFEDAVSGVQAGEKGNFGLVIGISRSANASMLKKNGADVVVEDLDELDPEEIDHLFCIKNGK